MSGFPYSSESDDQDGVRILATCSLGLGFSYNGFRNGLRQKPHLIACDAGSADFGPYYLGAGVLQKGPGALRRDLTILLEGALELGVPFITGSAGGAGGRPHLDATVELVREIAREKGLHFKLAVIRAEISPDFVIERLRAGRVKAVGDVVELSEEAVSSSAAIVGMMGVEPFVRALEAGAEVIIAGRSTDPAIFASVPLRAGMGPGPAWHASKCIDKGYLATTRPQDGSPVLARIGRDGFSIEPTREGAECTVKTVAGVTLHENPDPFLVMQPSGTIDTIEATYDQIDERTVRVRGSAFRPAAQPSIKLEGARLIGYRRILLCGLRDPRLIARIDEFLDAYRAALARIARSMSIAEADYQLQFRVYGRDAVMGPLEPLRHQLGHELGLIVDLVGKSWEIAQALGTRLGPTGSRLDISGGLGGGGNFAYPFSPSLIDVGPAFDWSVWHIVEVDEEELTTLFPIDFEDL